jgi:glycerophosphoryl diester phosphodiesterase
MTYTNKCIRIAHRGASAHAPENTLAAFSKALEFGVDGVELDVQGSADDEAVVIHDATLERTTNLVGKARNRTLAEFREADAGSWFDARFGGERIPTLAQALDLLKGKAIAVVEIKDRGIASAVVSTIRLTQAVRDVFAISFHPSVLLEVRSLNPRIPTGLLISEEVPAGEERAHAIDCVQRTCETAASTLNVNHRMVTPEFSYQARRRGMTLWAWTVNEVGRMRELISLGVQGITSDRPEKFDEI